MTEQAPDTDPLQDVRDRAAAYQQRLDSDEDNPKADTLAKAAVQAAARHAVQQDVSKADVAKAAGVDIGELKSWLT